jgi:hypothetical protein
MINVKRSLACLLVMSLPVVPIAALAQANQTFRTEQVVAGKPSRLGYVSTLGKDCNSVPLGDIKVTAPPKKGSVSVREGKVKSTRCSNKEMSVKVVIYKAPEKYTGDDQVVLEVKHSDGRVEAMTIKIEVKNQPASSPPGSSQKKEMQDL